MSFPQFARVASLTSIVYLAFALSAAAQEPANRSLPQAQVLLPQAQAVLAQHASVEAKLRQQIHLFDQQLFGSGTYLQQGNGPETLVRLEVKIQVAGQVSSLLQIADGRYLWTEQQLGQQRLVRRTEIELLRTELPRQYLPDGRLQVVGGLSQLLAGLAANFEFGPVTLDQLGEVPTYTFTGKLRAARLAEYAAFIDGDEEEKPAFDPEQLPDHLPDEVQLTLGRDDLFPYRIDYRRSGAEQGSAQQLLLRIELFEVRLGSTLDLREFVYAPGNVSVTDDTEADIKQLTFRKSGKRKAESGAAARMHD